MPNLFSTLGRAALIAIGLAVAPAAFAQGAFNICPAGFTPLFTPAGSQSIEATCQVDCGAGNITVLNGATVSCTAGTGGGTKPTNCSLAILPASSGGPAATAVTLRASCSSGTAPFTLAWTGSGTSGCATSTSTWPVDCDVGSIAATTTWSLVISNGTAPNYSSGNKTFTYTAGGGGTDFVGCPADAKKLASFYPVARDGDTGAGVYSGKWLSIKMKVPANAPIGSYLELFFSGTYGSGTGTWAISENACDVDNPIVDPLGSKYSRGNIKYVKGFLNPNISSFFYNYGPTQATTTAIGNTMVPGKTYYLNVKFDTCSWDGNGGCGFSNAKLP